MTYNAKQNDQILTDPALIVSVTAESDALDLTAANSGSWLDVSGWQNSLSRNTDGSPTTGVPKMAVKEFCIEIGCDASETLTGTPKLYAMRALPVTLADDDVDTVDFANNELDLTTHAYLHGDGPVRLTTTDTLPAGLSTGTDYWIIYVGAGSISLAASLSDALSRTAVAFTDGGTGTHTIEDVQTGSEDNRTKRLKHCLMGSLNGGSNIAVAAQTGYIELIQHDPLNLAYAVVATETGAQTLTMRATSRQAVEW